MDAERIIEGRDTRAKVLQGPHRESKAVRETRAGFETTGEVTLIGLLIVVKHV